MFRLFLFSRFIFLRSLLLLLAAAFCYRVQAQLCNGSLGDPVVNITLGAGESSPFLHNYEHSLITLIILSGKNIAHFEATFSNPHCSGRGVRKQFHPPFNLLRKICIWC